MWQVERKQPVDAALSLRFGLRLMPSARQRQFVNFIHLVLAHAAKVGSPPDPVIGRSAARDSDFPFPHPSDPTTVEDRFGPDDDDGGPYGAFSGVDQAHNVLRPPL